MTIIYQYRVANTSLGGFFKLLLLWKGSVYKLLFKETLIFGLLYGALSVTYRLGLTSQQRQTFENTAIYLNRYTNLIPISFVLGFYVSLVVRRWWQQFRNVPWPDRTLFTASCYIRDKSEDGRILRRTIARYMMFAFILIMRSVSNAVKKRYPTMEHIVDAGFITSSELDEYLEVDCKYNKFWVPLMWANSVLAEAHENGKLSSEYGLRLILEQLANYRDKCSACFVYDWITIPLVYTQVVTVAVYTFFAACIVGRQFLNPDANYEGYEYDLYVPVFTLLQFFFYMGWLKVAEQLINPFGEDDDDFDINWLIDRHMAVAMCLADQCHGKHPPLTKDAHFDEVVNELPYTEAALSSRRPTFLGSTFNQELPSVTDQQIIDTEDLDDVVAFKRSRRHSLAAFMNYLQTPRRSLSSLLGSNDRLHSKLEHGSSSSQIDVHKLKEDRKKPKGRRVSIDVMPSRHPNVTFSPYDKGLFRRGSDENHSSGLSDLKEKLRLSPDISRRSGDWQSGSNESIERSPVGKRRLPDLHCKRKGGVVSRPPLLSDIDECSSSVRRVNTLPLLEETSESESEVECTENTPAGIEREDSSQSQEAESPNSGEDEDSCGFVR